MINHSRKSRVKAYQKSTKVHFDPTGKSLTFSPLLFASKQQKICLKIAFPQ